MYNDELYHYGVLGMKWGVRRYQNKDGTLTPAGRERLHKIADKAVNQRIESNKRYFEKHEKRNALKRRQFGIKQTKDPNTDVLKKGSKIYRMANSGEPIDSKRKYVSITENDRLSYQGMWEMLGLDWDRPISEYTYSSNKDLRIATGKAVTDYILDKYGNKTHKQLVEDLEFAKNITTYKVGRNNKIIQLIDNKDDNQWLENFKQIGSDKVEKLIDRSMTKHLNEITDKFKKRGYDAIVDIEDSGFLTDYPVIILDPNKSITQKKEKRL